MNLDQYLIVDDEKPIAELLVSFFSRKNIHATHLQSPYQALEFMQLVTPRVVISDYHMPGMTGMALYKQARSLGYNVPFVFMTGHVFDEALQREAKSLGISIADIIRKPFNLSEIDAKVENALKNNEYRLDSPSANDH